MVVLLVALSIFSSTVAATMRMRTSNRDNAVAAEAARVVLEIMRDQPFDQLLALYNADPLDDPGGQGTAPGHRFTVEGLEPAPESPDGMIGEIRFPVVNVGTDEEPDWELREDVDDRQLGMPRDLSGDAVTDEEDHASDYVRLPVGVNLAWQGEAGPRELTFHVMFCEFEYDER